MPEDRKQLLQKILSRYIGKKSFHNYTKVVKHLWYSHKFFLKKNITKIKTKFDNDTDVKEMMSDCGFGNSSAILRKWSDRKFYTTVLNFSVIEYPIIGGIEFARIKIVGTSFYKYQVRRMMGAVYKAMKDGLGEDFIDKTFDKKVIVLPIVPAEGLILKKANYEWETKHNSEGFDDVNPMYHNEVEAEEYRRELLGDIRFCNCSTMPSIQNDRQSGLSVLRRMSRMPCSPEVYT